MTGKEHKNLVRDINAMLEQLGVHSSNLNGGEESQYIRSANLRYETNQGVTCINYDPSNPNGWKYRLDYEHSQCLVSGYDAARRMALIKMVDITTIESSSPCRC